jgi:hypothetical protein
MLSTEIGVGSPESSLIRRRHLDEKGLLVDMVRSTLGASSDTGRKLDLNSSLETQTGSSQRLQDQVVNDKGRYRQHPFYSVLLDDKYVVVHKRRSGRYPPEVGKCLAAVEYVFELPKPST